MRITLLYVLLLFISHPPDAAAQQSSGLFYDALNLQATVAQDPITPSVYSIGKGTTILDAYVPPGVSDIAHFANNPFLKVYQIQSGAGGFAAGLATSSTAFQALGGLDVTTVADGISRFLVARTKHELTITFFDQLQKQLNADTPEAKLLSSLFPETKRTFGVIDTQIYNYTLYLSTLRKAFERDLGTLSTTLPHYLEDNPKVVDPTLATGVVTSVKVLNDIRRGTPIYTLLNRTDVVQALSSVDHNVGNGAELLGLVAGALRSTAPDRVFVPADSLAALDDHGMRIFMGLLYERLPNTLSFVRSGTTTKLKADILSQLGDQLPPLSQDLGNLLDPYREYAREVILQATRVSDDVNALKDVKLSDASYSDFAQYFSNSLDVLEGSLSLLGGLGIIVDQTNTDKFKSFLDRARLVSALLLDVTAKEYQPAIVSAIQLLQSASPKLDQEAYATLLKYGVFAATMVEAKTPEEVQQAIESVVLPPGSARIKKESKFNLALNAYVGLFAGSEYLGDDEAWGVVSGVHAPLGVAFSWGHGKAGKRRSFSLFASLIDVGAITAYRFSNDPTENLPEVHLKNIFSPGVHLIRGFSGVPISAGLGVQLGPALREIDDGSRASESINNFRAHAFVAVDIPLLNLQTRTR